MAKPARSRRRPSQRGDNNARGGPPRPRAARRAWPCLPLPNCRRTTSLQLAGSVAGTGKDGRVTKGDVLAAVASASASATPARIPAGRTDDSLPQVAAHGRHPGRAARAAHVPMSRLRPCGRALLQSQATNAVSPPSMKSIWRLWGDAQTLREKFRKRARRQNRLYVVFVKAAVHALKKKYPCSTPVWTVMDICHRLL